MEVAPEKIDGNDDGDGDGGSQVIVESDAYNGNGAAAEDREQHARELKAGLHPLKDSANCNGGKWIIRFKKVVVSGRLWEDLSVMALTDSIKWHLKLPHGYVMEYKPHDASLRDHSSNCNTWLRG